MPNATESNLQQAAREHAAAVEIIADFLAELIGMTREQRYHNAAALIARLASHDPPILLTMAGEATQTRDTNSVRTFPAMRRVAKRQ